jgi:hypothetical protein
MKGGKECRQEVSECLKIDPRGSPKTREAAARSDFDHSSTYHLLNTTMPYVLMRHFAYFIQINS